VTTTATGKKCKATTKNGQPCAAWALAGSDFCFWHDPAHVKERAAARAKGGRARHGRQIGEVGNAAPVEIHTMADVVALLQNTINDALSLENSLQRARTIGSLASVIIKALEYATLEERVEALEQALKSR
jgi:hypothetical protein